MATARVAREETLLRWRAIEIEAKLTSATAYIVVLTATLTYTATNTAPTLYGTSISHRMLKLCSQARSCSEEAAAVAANATHTAYPEVF